MRVLRLLAFPKTELLVVVINQQIGRAQERHAKAWHVVLVDVLEAIEDDGNLRIIWIIFLSILIDVDVWLHKLVIRDCDVQTRGDGDRKVSVISEGGLANVRLAGNRERTYASDAGIVIDQKLNGLVLRPISLTPVILVKAHHMSSDTVMTEVSGSRQALKADPCDGPEMLGLEPFLRFILTSVTVKIIPVLQLSC